MKGSGETSTKLQSLTDTTVVDDDARYTSYMTTFAIDYDDATNPLEVGDTLTFKLQYDRTGSTNTTDIIVNRALFRYKSTKPNQEV
jgi:hypothetical protein